MARHILENAELFLVCRLWHQPVFTDLQIGMLNPDGRIHLEQTGDYCWRNTGTSKITTAMTLSRSARGVDLNRNFDWEFNGPGSSSKRGHEEYNGGFAFSEPETRLIRDLTARQSFDGFFSLHSGEQQGAFSPHEKVLKSLQSLSPLWTPNRRKRVDAGPVQKGS